MMTRSLAYFIALGFVVGCADGGPVASNHFAATWIGSAAPEGCALPTLADEALVAPCGGSACTSDLLVTWLLGSDHSYEIPERADQIGDALAIGSAIVLCGQQAAAQLTGSSDGDRYAGTVTFDLSAGVFAYELSLERE